MILVRLITVVLVFLAAAALSLFLYRQHQELLSGSRVVEKGQELAGKLLPDNTEQRPSEESQNSASLPVKQGKTELDNSQKGKDRSPEIAEEGRHKAQEQKAERSLSPLASSSFPSSLERKEEPRDGTSLSPADLLEEIPLEDVPTTPPVVTPKEEIEAQTSPVPSPPPFAGRSLEEITREEISAILQKRREAERLLDRARRGGWR